MILDNDVANQEGRRLLSKGQKLSEKEIRILKMWGVPEITIQTADMDREQEATDNSGSPDEETNAFLDKWFENNDRKNPVVKIVHDICLERMENQVFEIVSPFQGKKGTEKSDVQEDIKTVEQVKKLLKTDLKLPALPTIFSEINDAIKNPKCSGKDIADIVSKDPSLSATLLKIVNSAYYGLPEPVESLHYAAMALGTHQVSSLALGITVMNYFKGITNQRINMESFWKHSLACGIASKTLATQIRSVPSDRVFVGGLLHDIGWLVFLESLPQECNEIFKKAKMLGLSMYQVEPRFLGMTHARFGSLLAKGWNFPNAIATLIDHHHDNFKKTPPIEIAIVYFSNWLVDAIGIGFTGEQELARLNMHAWNALGLPESVLTSIVKQIDRQLAETIKFFND